MRIIVSAGGTGGHIYPALSIINKFREKETNLDILYIGTHNRMEKDIIPQNNIQYEPIEIYGFSKTNIKNDLKNIYLIPKDIKKCKELMKQFKPDVVLGIGGYVTYPVIKAAHSLGIKTFIHEQNSLPGKTNRSLAKIVDLVGVSFTDSMSYFPNDKVFYSGNPCGENAINIQPMDKTKLGFDKNKKLVVIVCGSLGSATVSRKIKDYLINFNEEYEVLYITGKSMYEAYVKDTKFPKGVKVVPYLDNLSSLLKVADLIVTRAGASTMSEVISLEKPSIFIPSPFVANNHQFYNALELKNNNAGEIIEEDNLDSEILKTTIDKIINDKKLYNEMKKNLSNLAINNSSEIIYKKIKDMIK